VALALVNHFQYLENAPAESACSVTLARVSNDSEIDLFVFALQKDSEAAVKIAISLVNGSSWADGCDWRRWRRFSSPLMFGTNTGYRTDGRWFTLVSTSAVPAI
jgi:hypothetical protein